MTSSVMTTFTTGIYCAAGNGFFFILCSYVSIITQCMQLTRSPAIADKQQGIAPISFNTSKTTRDPASIEGV